MKKLKIAVINDVHVGPPLQRNNHVRAYSHLAETSLPSVLKYIETQHKPDLLVNLGDLIRTESLQADLDRYSRTTQLFRNLKTPVLHLIGNHEITQMPLQDVETIWSKHGFNQKSYGRIDVDAFSILWLGMECHPTNNKLRYLPAEQESWLKSELKNHLNPTVIFTHCPIDNQIVQGLFWVDAQPGQDPSSLFLTNQNDIQAICGQSPVKAVIQAHLHYFHAKEINGIPYITCPAMGDNICAPSQKEHIPEIYSIITVDAHKFTARAYSREFCFAGYELDF